MLFLNYICAQNDGIYNTILAQMFSETSINIRMVQFSFGYDNLAAMCKAFCIARKTTFCLGPQDTDCNVIRFIFSLFHLPATFARFLLYFNPRFHGLLKVWDARCHPSSTLYNLT